MHNLHLVRVKEKSHEDACNLVDDYLCNWGNENNWKSVGGSLCKDGTLKNHDDYARWMPVQLDEDGNSVPFEKVVSNLNSMCLSTLSGDEWSHNHQEAINEILGKSIEELVSSEFHSFDLWRVKEFLRFLYNTTYAREKVSKLKSYDIFTSDPFYEGCYGDFGLSDISSQDTKKDCKTYIVFVDMHS